MSAFIVGTFIGWASPIKIKMDNGETPLTCSDSNWGWATASPSMGSVIGSIFAGTIADYFGRRWALLLTAPLYLFAWALVYFAENCYLIIISRIIVGIALAIMFPVSPPLFFYLVIRLHHLIYYQIPLTSRSQGSQIDLEKVMRGRHSSFFFFSEAGRSILSGNAQEFLLQLCHEISHCPHFPNPICLDVGFY